MISKSSKPLFVFSTAIAIAAASVVGISWLLATQGLSAPVRLALALVPVAAFTFCMILELRLLRQCDELQQRILLETLAISFPGLAIAIITCEYLRKAGFISYLKPDHVLMMMIVLFFVGFFVARRRYR